MDIYLGQKFSEIAVWEVYVQKLTKKQTFFQQIAFKNLVERNKEREKREGPPPPNSAIQLPFIIVNTSKKTVIDCRYLIFDWSESVWIDLVSRFIA